VEIPEKIMLAFAVWVVVSIFIVITTRKPSRHFSSFTTRTLVAGLSLLTVTLTLNMYTGFIFIDYYKDLVRAADYEKSFSEDFVIMSVQHLIGFTTLFSSMFGASLGGSLLYKAAYPRN
jgi:hypothetical protein